ncbi:MAG: hypothetical protein ACI85I_001820 [Arenicella sp.]
MSINQKHIRRILLLLGIFIFQFPTISGQSNLIDVKRVPVFFPEKIQFVANAEYVDWLENKNDTATIIKIVISGNKKTKDWIIKRELQYVEGSKIPTFKLDSLLKLEANKVFNTNLFITAKVGFTPVGNGLIELRVEVIEKLYTYIFPVFDLADRNFNEWWQNQGGDLNRAEYGLNFRRRNVRGRNESFNVDFRWGFNRKVKVSYIFPYINKARTLGLSTGFQYLTNRNVPYATENDKLAFLDSENTVRKRFRYDVRLSKRDSFYTTHSLSSRFLYESVSDSVLDLNPFYFGDGTTRKQAVKVLSLTYSFNYNFTDIQAYPLNGKILDIKLSKYGLGFFGDVDMWEVYASYRKFTHLGGRFYLANQVAGKFSSPVNQPYGIAKGLGYVQDFVRGYDLYVIDADKYTYNRNTIRFKLLDKVFDIKKYVPFKQFNTLPVLVMLKAYFDNGYSQNKGFAPDSNRLDNRWLYGGGVGLDIFSFYNSTLKMEYSLNGLGEQGFFFYYNASF